MNARTVKVAHRCDRCTRRRGWRRREAKKKKEVGKTQHPGHHHSGPRYAEAGTSDSCGATTTGVLLLPACSAAAAERNSTSEAGGIDKAFAPIRCLCVVLCASADCRPTDRPTDRPRPACCRAKAVCLSEYLQHTWWVVGGGWRGGCSLEALSSTSRTHTPESRRRRCPPGSLLYETVKINSSRQHKIETQPPLRPQGEQRSVHLQLAEVFFPPSFLDLSLAINPTSAMLQRGETSRSGVPMRTCQDAAGSAPEREKKSRGADKLLRSRTRKKNARRQRHGPEGPPRPGSKWRDAPGAQIRC